MNNKKYAIDNLVIETTRRCNMTCDHCLRGEQQKIDLPIRYLEQILKNIDVINSVTFSGGEPSLVPNIIEEFINLITKYQITVNDFYIATNGKKITPEFVISLCKLYCICDSPEDCLVQISSDYYHQVEHTATKGLLSALNFVFFRDRNRDPGEMTFINEGYYKEYFNNGRENNKEKYIIDNNFITEGNIYLNCKGNIIAGCDWSYESQDKEENIICRADENILKAIKEKGLTYE
jgi:organic radical activating enzyme